MSFDNFLREVRSECEPPVDAEERVHARLLGTVSAAAAVAATVTVVASASAQASAVAGGSASTALIPAGLGATLAKGTVVVAVLATGVYVVPRMAKKNGTETATVVASEANARTAPQRASSTRSANTPRAEQVATDLSNAEAVEPTLPAVLPAPTAPTVPARGVASHNREVTEAESTAPAAPAPSVPTFTLTDELAALARIERALRSGAPARALQELERLPAANLTMHEEFAAARTRAQCLATSDRNVQQALWSAFAQRHPISPSLARVRNDCGESE